VAADVLLRLLDLLLLEAGLDQIVRSKGDWGDCP